MRFKLIGASDAFQLIQDLASPNSETRWEASGRAFQWITSLSRNEATLIILLLVNLVSVEEDSECREAQIHTLLELSSTGFIERWHMAPLLGLDVDSLNRSEYVYFEDLKIEFLS